MARGAGSSIQILGFEGRYALLRLTSGEVRKVLSTCRATIGEVGNEDHELVNLGKAGRKIHMGIRPTVRGSVMNPNDHPHGGGEGRAPVGHKGPLTPWGKPALGYKTRKKKEKHVRQKPRNVSAEKLPEHTGKQTDRQQTGEETRTEKNAAVLFPQPVPPFQKIISRDSDRWRQERRRDSRTGCCSSPERLR